MLKKNFDRQADTMSARLQEQGISSVAVSRKNAEKKQSIKLIQQAKKKEQDPTS
jgi:hypothetical protein